MKEKIFGGKVIRVATPLQVNRNKKDDILYPDRTYQVDENSFLYLKNVYGHLVHNFTPRYLDYVVTSQLRQPSSSVL